MKGKRKIQTAKNPETGGKGDSSGKKRASQPTHAHLRGQAKRVKNSASLNGFQSESGEGGIQ